jgi:hypothetical protein
MAGVIDTQVTYDVVLGLDFLCQFKIDNLNSTQEIHWLDHKLEYCPRDTFSDRKSLFHATFESLAQVNHSAHDPEDQAAILDAKYAQIDTNHLAEQQFHLNRSQRHVLANLLKKFTKLFDGTLGVYPHKKMHLKLIQNAQPVHKCPYAVPVSHHDTFRKELAHLVDIGVLEPSCSASEWASPTLSLRFL